MNESDYAVLYDNELNYRKELKRVVIISSNGNKSLFFRRVKNSRLIMENELIHQVVLIHLLIGLITALVILKTTMVGLMKIYLII